jgi:hypothetical protein
VALAIVRNSKLGAIGEVAFEAAFELLRKQLVIEHGIPSRTPISSNEPSPLTMMDANVCRRSWTLASVRPAGRSSRPAAAAARHSARVGSNSFKVFPAPAAGAAFSPGKTKEDEIAALPRRRAASVSSICR